MIDTRRARLLTISMVLSISLPFLASCSSADSTPTPVISGSQAPAPGSANGVHSVADTDYEQTALVVDTTQVELDQIALDPSRKASAAVQAIAKQSAETVGPEATVLRKKLVTDGNATTDEHHKPAVGSTQIAALKKLSGAAFDTAWARAMTSLNEQVIAAAVTELNVGEDKETRTLARAKIDYASAQNGALRPIAK